MKAGEHSTDYLNDICDATGSVPKELDFKEINQVILQNIQNIEAVKCPDEYVGILEISNNIARFNKNWILAECRERVAKTLRRNFMTGKSKILLIVLESPHNDEFKNGTAVGPAMGETGKNLTKYFTDLFNNSLKKIPEDRILDGAYRVVLCNAIQYKASLGYDTTKYRDRVWINSWVNGYCDGFKERLSVYNPMIIVNLCTHGDHSQDELYTGKNKKQMTIDFLESINSDATANYKANSIKCHNSNHNNCYPLYGFVQTAIEYVSSNSPYIVTRFIGTHPCSWSRNIKNRRIKWSE